MFDVPAELPTRLADLVASRLCHDLVNPLGAIGNGVELLEMTGKADGPEMELIRDAVSAAQARIRLFRLAFGSARQDQNTSLREAREAVEGYFDQSRIRAHWDIETDLSRVDTKIAFLMLLCAETTLPMGGDIRMAQDETGALTLVAEGTQLNVREATWSLLDPGGPKMDFDALRPADAQYPVLVYTSQSRGLTLERSTTEERLTLSAR